MSEGRGRGESKHIHLLEEGYPAADRQAQMEAAQQLGLSESQISVRGRGGFRQPELRTIPENVTALRAKNLAGARQVDIMANYVQMRAMPNRVVHMYRIDFEPTLESTSLMNFLFKTAANQLFTSLPSYDRGHECRSGQKLAETVTSTEIANNRDSDNRQYKVTFTHTGTVTFGAESLRLYNIHMKEFLRDLGFYQPQTGIYVNPNQSSQVNDEIMMMRGFRTSANLHDDGKMLMNLEGAHKLVQKKSVLQLMAAIRQKNPANLRQALEVELTGKVVVTSYNKRVYRVEEIDFTKRPTSTFDRNGTPVTFIEYYHLVHNLDITDTSQPLLKCVPNNQRKRDEVGKEALLVPEFCNLAGLTDPQRNDNRLKFDLIKASQVPPTDRVAHMRKFLSLFHANADIKRKLTEWGYSYDDEPVKLKAYVIPATNIAYGRITNEPPTNWLKSDMNTADINVNGLAVVPAIKKLAFLVAKFDLQQKNTIRDAIREGFQKVGLSPGSVEFIDMPEGDQAAHYISRIRNLAPDTDIAIVVMNRQNKERYDAIKKVASVEKGLITQVVTAKLMTDQRKARSAATKIAIQIAAKVGGEPWWADIPLRNTMICGYDTYHDTAQRGRSFGAFLASMNMRFSRWWSKADAHDRMDEISAQVSANITEAMKHYRKFNDNAFPERVVIYRDGVGEGQLEHVYNVELKRIQEALEAVGSPTKIRLTVIIVNKRIGARFYMRAGDGFANPPPGTVIDHTVTRQQRYDFYLVSQSTRQGSITPTYYNIIHDEAGFPPEIHQKMAFKFCLMYYNWAGTVRVPAPCQYAHKLALLCGEHLHAQPNATLDNKLHFL